MTDERLRRLDRVADARCRIQAATHAAELDALCATARATGAWSVPVSALATLADAWRKSPLPAAPGTNVVELHSYSRKEPA